MLVHSDLQQQSTLRLLWSGILAVGILCLLAAWSFGDHAEYTGSDAGRNGYSVSTDMPLQANSEYSLGLKRFLIRYKDQPKPVEPPEPVWSLASSNVIAVLPLAAANQQFSVGHSPLICLYQLQTLNISRAPPLV
jgi:hypothetical protein